MYIFEASIFGIHIAPTWYGLMYAIGFSFCYFFVARYGYIKQKDMESLLFYIFLGVILGGRIGYVVLYSPVYFLDHPDEIIAIWKGGMSFHGGFLGVLIAVLIFSKRYSYEFFSITDILAICIPVALGLGRIGNWVNGELPGFAGYTGIFHMTIGDMSYFPSPLLQAFLEGVILTMIMLISWKILGNRRKGILSAIFLIGYATMRIIAEQFRLPDSHIGYILGTNWITIGLLYTIPMLITGIILIAKNKETNE